MSGFFAYFREWLLSIWPYIDWVVAVLLCILILKLLEQFWLFYRQVWYKETPEQTLYEIKIPRMIERGPKAMEQFFAGLHSFRNTPGSPGEKYYDGEVTREFFFELLGSNGMIHLFMRFPRFYAEAIKSLLYAQYNDLEIIEQKEDYLKRLPRTYDQLSDLGYEIWGQEAYLAEDDAYPVKTYAEFEEKRADERVVDPIAFFTEVVSNMPSDETIMLQFIIEPEGPEHLQHAGQKIMKKMLEKRKVLEGGVYKGRTDPENETDKETAKAVERKISKDAFKCLIRYIHIAPKATFNVFFGYRNFFAFFNQLATDTNRFTKNTRIWTKVDWYNFPFIFPNRRLLEKKRGVYEEYLRRYTPEQIPIGNLFRSNFWRLNIHHKMSILNTEELATLFHPPTNVVITTGLMDRVESKRLAPPSNLPS